MFEDAKALQAHIDKQRGQLSLKRLKARQRFNRDLATRSALVAMGFKRADAVQALQAVRGALSAEQTHFFSHNGVVADERTTVDHRTRLKAAQAIFDMVPGVKAPQELVKTSSDIQLEVLTVAPDGTRTAVRVTG